MEKIWNSELSSFNKVIAHNTFAVPVFVTSVGIVDWTINEIKETDCKTRKQLTMTGNFHRNGDVGRLHIPRSEGGRGLKSTVRMYESRIVSVVQHFELNKSHNTSLQFVVEQELNNIIRLKEKLLANYQIEKLPLGHDEVAKTFLYSHIKKYSPDKKIALTNESE